MGVNHLWKILDNGNIYIEEPSSYFVNKTIAVDLATWIIEMEIFKANFYLRLLFFRIVTFTRLGIKLVFVLDGDAPMLKKNTINLQRKTLKAKFEKCIELFNLVGIPWVICDGEAEALCAHLNREGLVDIVATNDADAFLYGAEVVCRKMSAETMKKSKVYKASTIKEKLGYTQHSLICLAVLIGCSFNSTGINGMGKVKALKLLSTWKSRQHIQELKKYIKENEKLYGYTCSPSKQNRDYNMVIEEYLSPKHALDKNNNRVLGEALKMQMQRKDPDFNKLVVFLQNIFPDNQWDAVFAKLLSLMSYWFLQDIRGKVNATKSFYGIKIKRLERINKRKKMSFIKVVWEIPQNMKMEEESCTTKEPITLVEKNYSHLITKLLESDEKDATGKRQRKMTDYFGAVKKQKLVK